MLIIGVSMVSVAGTAAARSPTKRQVLEIVPCATTFGIGPDESAPAPPKRLPVALPRSAARALAFYSNGRITFLAPKGWECEGIVGADGSEQLQAFPKKGAPGAGNKLGESVVVVSDYTGHGPGAQLVCPYFPNSPAARFFGDAGPDCPALPEGRVVERETEDVVTFTEPGGTVGEVVYPQSSREPSFGAPVTYAECTLRGARRALCIPILDDVLARRSPVVPMA